MLSILRAFFADRGDPGSRAAHNDDSALQLATTVLLVQVMRADREQVPSERQVIGDVLRGRWELSAEDAEGLLVAAEEQADQSIALDPFTRLLDEALSLPQKIDVVELLWRVVWADEALDSEEEFVVRKVSGLLHVPHRDFIAAKRRARRLILGEASGG